MRDLASRLAAVSVFGPIAMAADNTPVAIDLQNYNSAALLLAIGIGGITFDGSNKIEFKLTHSDDNVTYTDVVASDLNGKDAPAVVTTGIIKSLIVAHAAAAVYELGYVGGKRYLKLLADFTGTHGAGTPVTAIVVKGDPRVAPAA